MIRVLQIFYFSGLSLNDILYVYPEKSSLSYSEWKKEILNENSIVLDNYDSWIEEYQVKIDENENLIRTVSKITQVWFN